MNAWIQMCEDSGHINCTVSGIKWKWSSRKCNFDQTFDIGIWPSTFESFSVSHYLLRWKIDNYILYPCLSFVPPGGWAFPPSANKQVSTRSQEKDWSGRAVFWGRFFLFCGNDFPEVSQSDVVVKPKGKMNWQRLPKLLNAFPEFLTAGNTAKSHSPNPQILDDIRKLTLNK